MNDEVVGVDLNRDSLKDLLVLSFVGRSETARWLASVFFQKPGRSFSGRPNLIWELDRTIAALDPSTDDLPQSGRGTLLSICADGIFAHRLDAEGGRITSSRVLTADASHLLPHEEDTLLLDFAACSTDALGNAADWT